MTKNEKLKQSRIKKGLTQAEFASLLGVKQAYISGLETSQTFGIKKAKEMAKFLDVDPIWLYNDDKNSDELSQKSNINQKAIDKTNSIGNYNHSEFQDIAQVNTNLTYDENSTFPLTKERPTTNTIRKGVPYYDIDFMGGFDLVFNSQQIQPSFYIDFLPFNDCDCWINVTGKSMGPLIAHGDIVGLKKVDNWQRFLLEGEIYAVITDNGFRTIKMIGAGPDKESYTLIPYNKSEEYKPQIIPKEVITHVFRVKGNIKKFF